MAGGINPVENASGLRGRSLLEDLDESREVRQQLRTGQRALDIPADEVDLERGELAAAGRRPRTGGKRVQLLARLGLGLR
jgi:hypothetical protein